MVDIRDIYSLSEFQRNTKRYIEQLQSSHKPAVLTVNGKAALVVQDAESYQLLLDELELARSAMAIKQSMQEFEAGQGRDAKEALKELGVKLGVSS